MKLKVYTLVNCIVVLVCVASQTEAIMEDNILEFLEEIRNRMCYPLFGLPALDPLHFEHGNFNMDNKYIVNLTSSITNFRLTGLSDFNVTNLKISLIPLRRSNFSIVLPLTSATSFYTAHGSLGYIINLDGDGKAEGHIDNVRLSISWVLKTGLNVGIRDLRIEINIKNLFVDIENLMEEPRLNAFFHALINEMGIELLNDLWIEAQQKGFIKYVEDTLNKLLGSYTLSDIIKIISGITGGGDSTEPPFGGTPADCKMKL